mgnify:CR=1 FL=1
MYFSSSLDVVLTIRRLLYVLFECLVCCTSCNHVLIAFYAQVVKLRGSFKLVEKFNHEKICLEPLFE